MRSRWLGSGFTPSTLLSHGGKTNSVRVVDSVAAMLAVELEGDAMHTFNLEDRGAPA